MRRKNDAWWAVPTVGFLLAVAITLFVYPELSQEIISYFLTLERYGKPIMPPYNVGKGLILFFSISGIWGIVSVCLRFFFRHPTKKIVEDIMGSFFAFFLSSILSGYYSGSMSGKLLIPIFILGLVVVIVINVVASVLISSRKKVSSNN